MKALIPMNEHGIFCDRQDRAMVDSRYVAEAFEKAHKNVLQDIRELDCSEDFSRLNFQPSNYIDERGKKQPCVAMTRDGFTFLAMGYRGKKAAQFKEAYIRRFNEMERLIREVAAVRADFPMLTANIKLLHGEAKSYHYSNEVNMLYRIVTGKSGKELRMEFGLEKGESIRARLTEEQLRELDELQKLDAGLMLGVPDYETRRRTLEWYAMKRREEKRHERD